MTTDLIESGNSPAVPQWLASRKGPTGTEGMQEYATTPRLRVIHATSREEDQERHGLGSAVIEPDGIVAAQFDQRFVCCPVGFYTSWAQWFDINDKGKDCPLPFAERSIRRDSELAKRCANWQNREEPYPDNPKFSYTFQESLNFVMVVLDGQAQGVAAEVEFRSGGHAVGRRLSGYLARRGEAGVPLWANRIALHVGKRKSGDNSWFQLDFDAADPPFVDEATGAPMEKKFKAFTASYKSAIGD